MRIRHLRALCLPVLIVVAGSSSVTAYAQASDDPAGQIISLSPEQKREAIDSGGTAPTAPAADISGRGGGAGQIHGEIGAMIGTGGARSIYGTAAVPLGENAGAILSFEKSRYGRSQGWIPVCTGPRCRAGLPE